MATANTKSATKKDALLGCGFIVFVGIMVFGSGLVTIKERDGSEIAEQRPEKAYAEKCTIRRYGSEALWTARVVVEERLNDPRSARFEDASKNLRLDNTTCTFSVTGEFSAKNGFGGRVRGYYDVKVRRTEDGRWLKIAAEVV